MIPKKIHYCWFGRTPLPRKILKYIDSWHRYLPECEIKEWNEDNFDINKFEYTKQAYFAKKYAFVSDVARLYALVQEGGVYLDTDILVLKSIDSYLWNQRAFIGFEHGINIGTGVIAAEAGHPFFCEFYRMYESRSFFKGLRYDEETNVWQITRLFENKGLVRNNTMQLVSDVLVCPQNFFCNKDWGTGLYYNDENSIAIHDFQSSWCDSSKCFFHRVKRKLKKIITIGRYRWTSLKI